MAYLRTRFYLVLTRISFKIKSLPLNKKIKGQMIKKIILTVTVIPCWGTRALIPKVICEVHAQTLTPSMFDALHVQLWCDHSNKIMKIYRCSFFFKDLKNHVVRRTFNRVNVCACTSHMTLGINARVPQHGITTQYKNRIDFPHRLKKVKIAPAACLLPQ
ncbi:hypothetical protein BpHYR1_037328 [Brachionus plicatilis]|uniref:Uncharacterized protein n=1 Tax=Brachionus plicatilis TaxID=10195 RepID=A0A3M7RSP5_BRAPC|nr:hypothetical protein BpHYR1_037328 [Brachionus plicatilis]